MSEALVWYCRNKKCRRILRTKPPHALAYGCKCKVPRLPTGPTLVSWPGDAIWPGRGA